jgi:hypothetical protein
MSARAMTDRSRAAAHSYLRDPERFAETHDPEALARQIPLKLKQPRPRDAEAASGA